MGKIYTIIEVCKMLQIDRSTLRNMEDAGKIAPFFVGKRKRYSQSEVDRLMGLTMESVIINYKKLSPDAKEPYHAHEADAGFDLTATAAEEMPDGRIKYHSGIAVDIPRGYVGLVFPRSSVHKTNMVLSNSVGVIDAGYTGEITAIYYAGIMGEPYKVGERFAQLVIMPIPQIIYTEVTELSVTDRGANGYGSTGK